VCHAAGHRARSILDGLITGKSGVRRIETFDPSSFPVQIAAEVPSFDWQSQFNPKDRKHVPRPCRSRSRLRVKRSKTRNFSERSLA
jgi:3-oxoacyl-[acyl-carrier-protein] synthase II